MAGVPGRQKWGDKPAAVCYTVGLGPGRAGAICVQTRRRFMRGKKFLAWCRGEAVLLTAAVCAAVSALAVPPSAAYLGYIDLRVLCLLLCLMAVVAGLQHCGVFLVLSQRLLAGEKNVRLLQLLLVLLPFFSSMLITNDVALITFVPFTLQILELAGERRRVLPTVILQTAAANLGSMATPVGNPQNLFLCGHFHLSAGDFFSTLLPYTAVRSNIT